MKVFFGILLIVFSLFLSWVIASQKDFGESIIFTVLGAIITIFLTAGISIINDYSSPSITPIDVYRGKTTLEITYKDSIAIDSTVVWKEEIK